MNRRGFLRGLIAAPAIVAVGNIMPVRSIERLVKPEPSLYVCTVAGMSAGEFVISRAAAERIGRMHLLNAWEPARPYQLGDLIWAAPNQVIGGTAAFAALQSNARLT